MATIKKELDELDLLTREIFLEDEEFETKKDKMLENIKAVVFGEEKEEALEDTY